MLGLLFILGTINEWHDLITTHGLWINRNIFGTCYFTLVGFHAIHVTVGLIIMSTVFGLAWRGGDDAAQAGDRIGVVVLAFCGWGVGSGVYAGVYRGAIT